MNETRPKDHSRGNETLPRQCSPNSKVRRVLRWAEHPLAAVSGLVIFFVLTPASTWVYESMGCQIPLAPARYIICLGGNPSLVIEAARLLQEGYAEKLIVSNPGDGSIRMRDLAIDWGGRVAWWWSMKMGVLMCDVRRC